MSPHCGHVLRRLIALLVIAGIFSCCLGTDVYEDSELYDASDIAVCDGKFPIPGQPTQSRGDLRFNKTRGLQKESQCIWFVGNDTSNFTVYLIIRDMVLNPNDSLILTSRKTNQTIVELKGSQTDGIVLTSEMNITITLKLSNDTFDRAFAAKYSYASSVEQIQNIADSGRFFFIYGDIIKKTPFPKFDLTFVAAPNSAGGSKLLIDFEKFGITGKDALVYIDKAQNVDNTTAFKAPQSPPFILSREANVNFDLVKIENGTDMRLNYEVVTAQCSNVTNITSSYIDGEASTDIDLPDNVALQTLASFKCFNAYYIKPDQNQVAIANIFVKNFQFQNAFDSLLILDGDTRNSPVIASILPQYLDKYRKSYLYSTSTKLWVMYNSPVVINKTKSAFPINIWAKSQGGIVPNSDIKGTPIKITKELIKKNASPVVFIYEVQDGKQAVISMENNNKLPKANNTYMTVYNSIADNSNPPIISLQSQTDPPDFVASDTNQIRVQINSVEEDFNATLIAVERGCHSTANLVTYVTDSYSLSGRCNLVCSWLIPSRNDTKGQFVLKLSQLNLPEKTDSLFLEKFMTNTSKVFTLNGLLSLTAFPDLILDSSFSYTLYTKRQTCDKINSSVTLSGSVTYLANQIINPTVINVNSTINTTISSINYPNYYPLSSDIIWQFIGTNSQSVLLTFTDLQLVSKHQLFLSDKNAPNVTYDRNTTSLPSDYIASFPAFMKFSTETVESSPYSGRGFNVSLTLVEYGGYFVINAPNYEVSIKNITGISKCIWIVNVPNKVKDTVTHLEFNVTHPTLNDKETPNGQLVIYDSDSIRDSQHIMRLSYFNNTLLKSSTNTIIISYSKSNDKNPLTPVSFYFNSTQCNYSLCDNGKRCLLEEFFCNGVNDCGDWSDERNCNGTAPPPPPPPQPQPAPPTRTGVNGWVVLFVICPLCIGLGVIGTTYGPTFMRRFRRGRYTEFQDFSEVS